MSGHDWQPVPLWRAARRCRTCRLVAADFDTGPGMFTAWMSGGVLLGDSHDPGFRPPVCPAPYAPRTGERGRRGWRAVYGDAGRVAVPTPAQARILAEGLATGEPVLAGHRPAVVARVRTYGWLDQAYRVTASGAAAWQRRQNTPAPV
jgi:hypothetical protein